MKGIIPPFKATSILSYFIKGFTWTLPNNENNIYLTFDDGPIPEITSWVLDVLKNKGIKATFFCVGKNVEDNPTIFQRIIDEGHSVGNHTFDHLSGWKTDNEVYKTNIIKASALIESHLFRPPYGAISPNQYMLIRNDYKVIMWDVLSKDYDGTIDEDTCYHNVIDHVKSGSIIVMHDSLKASCNLRGSLEKMIDYLINKGFHFQKIEDNIEVNETF
jgi:peptidoglycan-N-acetylglucosamine deacetylase